MFSVIWFISLYFVIVTRFICSNNLYSSVVVSSSLKKSFCISIPFSKLLSNYPDIQSEVEENMTEASWLSCGSWGSSASKLEVEVERVGPRLGDASGASASSFLLFSPRLAILFFWNILLQITNNLIMTLFSTGTAVLSTLLCCCCVAWSCVWCWTVEADKATGGYSHPSATHPAPAGIWIWINMETT